MIQILTRMMVAWVFVIMVSLGIWYWMERFL